MDVLEKIAFLDIESIPLPIKDFLQNNIEGFDNHNFSIDNFRRQIQEKQNSFTESQRKILTKVLAEQNSSFDLTEKQKENINLLSSENTFTVVTGHQLNLFSGPAFFIYKILQTIKTAVFLKENFKDYHFVPIFWMASEDHDFAEINHFKTKDHYYEIQGKSGGAVGRIKIEDQFFIKNFEAAFKDFVYGTELIRWLKESYALGNSLSEATRILVQRIFADFGLLAIDGDSNELKSQMKDLFKDELLNFSLKKTTEKKVEWLTKKYGKVQVNPREINLFYLTETRDRIDFDGRDYFVVDKDLKFSKEDLLSELESFPEKFSPNALLRPVYQEKILPNLAYIGGNAEIMYWLELKDYFKKNEIPFPILIPRNSLLFLEKKLLKKTEKMGLKLNEFFGSFSKIMNEKLLENNEILLLLEIKEKWLADHFSELKSKAAITDKSFENLVKAEEKRQLNSFERMKKRLLRAEKIKQSEKIDRLQSLFVEVHPHGNWQERVFNFSVFYSELGMDWLDACYRELRVEKSELIIVEI